MRILRIVLLVLLVIVAVVVLGGFAFYWDTTRGPLPQTSGAVNVAGLENPVEILRDDRGIAHIYASTTHDLFFTQGYVQAQDRWWQMEFNRHIGSGAIEELTGQNDSLLGTDLFIRTAGWRRAAQRESEALDDDTRAILQAFADGVNAYTSSRPADKLAMEYRVLGLTGVNITVEPWTIVDSLAWGKVLSWNLTGSYDREITRATMLETLGEEMTTAFAPPFPYETAPTVLDPTDLPINEESIARAPNSTSVAFNTAQSNNSFQAVSQATSLEMAGSIRAGANTPYLTSAIGIGSNNWVATGEMTGSGMPLLANDPHLGIGMPSIWYEVGLHCSTVSEACPFDVIGFALPASPGIIIGHNANIAWGVTNVGADVQDLYRIEVNPENPLQYRWNDAWRDMTVIDETFNFGDGAESFTIQVRETHLGPIINDNQLNEAGEPEGFNYDDPMALRWTGHDNSTLFQSVMMLNQASDWAEFRAALAFWNMPSQNFVYADVQGNIGYQTPGSMPIRATDHTGLIPVDGTTDTYEWQGYIPFDELPRIYNPAREYIVTANQAVVPMAYYDELAESLGEDANYLLSYDWSYGQRGTRINDLITALAPHTPETYAQIHGDNRVLDAEGIFPALAGLPVEAGLTTEIRDWLLQWDFMADMDSAEASVWAYFSRQLLRDTFADQLPEGIDADAHNLFSIRVLLDTPEHQWWDDAATPDAETRDTILAQSFNAAIAEARADFGNDDYTTWRWGALHTATFESNPLGLSGISLIEDMVNLGPVETGGGYEIVNATAWDMTGDSFGVAALPSMRMVVDLADLDNARTTITTGQSGHPFSAHYRNAAEMWRTIGYHPMPFTRPAVEAITTERLTLSPAS